MNKPVIITLFVGLAVAGCVRTGPPAKVLEAIHQVDHYAPMYVDQANKALDQTAHPDAERLKGIGDRLVSALDALDRWALSLAEKRAQPQSVAQKEPAAE